MAEHTTRDGIETLAARSSKSHDYSALPLAAAPGSYIALNSQSHPALFVPAQGTRQSVHLRTEEMSLRTGVDCVLHVREQTVSGRFDVLQAETIDRAAIDTFAWLADAFLVQVASEDGSAEMLTTLFRTLRRLFGVNPALDLESERQGLWGELFLIELLEDTSRWATFWHTDPRKRFDLSSADERIEVKTARGTERSHSFSYRQLLPKGKEQIAVASLLLQENPDKLSLRTLIERTRASLAEAPVQLAKLESAVRGAGMTDPDLRGPSFDDSLASEDLAWFWAHEVPRITQEEPIGVSNIRYTVNLSSAPQIPGRELSAWLDSWREEPAGGSGSR